MVCKHCGKELREDDKFCPGCGAKIETGENTAEQEQSVEPVEEANTGAASETATESAEQDVQEAETDAVTQTIEDTAPIVQSSVTESSKGKSHKGVIIGVIAAVVVCAAIAAVVLWPKDPVKEYLSRFSENNSTEAMEIYNEQIAGDEELVATLTQTQDAEMDAIYSSYQSKQIGYDEAGEELQQYLEYDPSSAYAKEIQEKIDTLNDDRTAYSKAVASEESGNLEVAIKQYKKISESGENYDAAQEKITALSEELKDKYVNEAAEHAADKDYKVAISKINQAISSCGTSDELEKLLAEYTKAQEEKYAKVVMTNMVSHEADYSSWIFQPYIAFTFEITNYGDKAIKGIEGVVTFNDLFGKEIKQCECDFSGHTIAAGETYVNEDMSYECNRFMDDDMKLFNTDYSDLQAVYEIKTIVYEDGTSVTPD